MRSKSATTTKLLSCKAMLVIFFTLVVCHCCSHLTVALSLQVQTPLTRSFSSSRPLLSSKTTTSTKLNKRRRRRYASSSSSLNLHEHTFEDDASGAGSSLGMNRREVFSNSAKSLLAGLATPFLLDPTNPANALLLRFPVDAYNTQPLKNKYHFLRAGTSDLEVDGIYSTNPLFLTNRENGLSPKGYSDLRVAADRLKKSPLTPTVVYHSLAANGMDTGDYLARELKLGRDRLLPEFTYLDQRGIGLWDSNEESRIRPAVWAMDVMEAGSEGFGGRPPANTDGTPNDTLHDQFTRLRQFLSLQETRTSGEMILVIFPDGTGPALLSCMIAGIPYSEAHTLEFKPGELRLDITVESVKELYESRKEDPDYLATIEEGKEKLKELRSMKADDFSTSYKDSQVDAKQEEENKAYYEKQRAAAEAKQKADEERRAAMQEQVRLSREKQLETKQKRAQQELAVREKKEEKIREQKELAEKKKAELQASYVEKKQKQSEIQAAAKQKYADSQAASKKKQAEAQAALKKKQAEAQAAARAAKEQKQIDRKAGTDSTQSDLSLPFGLSPTVLATAAFGAIGAFVFSGAEDEDERNDNSAVTTKRDGSGDGGNASKTSAAVQEENPKLKTTSHITREMKQKTSNKEQLDVVEVVPVHSSVTTKRGDINKIENALNTTSISTSVQDKIAENKTAVSVTNDSLTSISPSVKNKTPENKTSVSVASDESRYTKKKKKSKLKPLHTSLVKEKAANATSISKAPKTEQPENKTTASGTSEKNRFTSRWKRPKRKPLASSRVGKTTISKVVKEENPETEKNLRHVSAAKKDEFTTKLQAAEQEMKDAFVEAADVKKKKQQQQSLSPKKKSSLFDNDPPVIVTKTMSKTTNFVYEDDEDDSDWLRVLSEIRDENEDDDDEDDFGMVDYAALAKDSQPF